MTQVIVCKKLKTLPPPRAQRRCALHGEMIKKLIIACFVFSFFNSVSSVLSVVHFLMMLISPELSA